MVSDHGYVWAKLVFYNFHSGYGKNPAATLVNRIVPDHHKSEISVFPSGAFAGKTIS